MPFSIEHWYSPYKRRHFENRSDQTFCILLIKDVLSVRECKPPPTPKIWNKSDPDSIRIFGLIWIRMSVKIVDTLVDVIHFAKFGSNRLLIVWELRKQRNDNKCRKIAYSSVVKKMKNRNPRADPDHHQKSTTSRGSPLARACQVWSTSVSAFVSYPVTQRMLVHLCGTLCPFISRTTIWLLQLSCAILSLIFFLSTDFVLSAFGVWSHKCAI